MNGVIFQDTEETVEFPGTITLILWTILRNELSSFAELGFIWYRHQRIYMARIDWNADSPNQLYTLLDGDLDSGMFGQVCEALRPLTAHSSQKTKLHLLDKALNYRRTKMGRDEYVPLNSDLVKFAKEVLVNEEPGDIRKMFFSSKTKPNKLNSINHLHELGVHCLNKKYEYLTLQSPEEADELIGILQLIDNQISFGLNTSALRAKIEKFKNSFH